MIKKITSLCEYGKLYEKLQDSLGYFFKSFEKLISENKIPALEVNLNDKKNEISGSYIGEKFQLTMAFNSLIDENATLILSLFDIDNKPFEIKKYYLSRYSDLTTLPGKKIFKSMQDPFENEYGPQRVILSDIINQAEKKYS